MCKKERQSSEGLNMLHLLLKVPSIGNTVTSFVVIHHFLKIHWVGCLSLSLSLLCWKGNIESGKEGNGGCVPDGAMSWNKVTRDNKELTMWNVVSDMLVAARGKLHAFASVDGTSSMFPLVSSHPTEKAWKYMAQTLMDANFGNIKEILETDPPKWLVDSAVSACMICNTHFHLIIRSRHHCSFCGGIFCNGCSKWRSLLPTKFRIGNPERLCDVCCVRLESVQCYLRDQVSRASQLPTLDLTDLSALRSWLNFPWDRSMESEILKFMRPPTLWRVITR